MIIDKQLKPEKRIEIDLTGPEGNAFYLIGLATDLARKLGYSSEGIGELTSKMIDGDYEHLVQTLDEYFGEMILIYR